MTKHPAKMAGNSSLSPQKELLTLFKSQLKTNAALQMETAKIEFKVI